MKDEEAYEKKKLKEIEDKLNESSKKLLDKSNDKVKNISFLPVDDEKGKKTKKFSDDDGTFKIKPKYIDSPLNDSANQIE
jgi:hypothetical protein